MSTRRLRLFRELPVSSTKQEKQNYAFHRGEEIKSPHWTVVVSPQQPSEKFPFYFDRSRNGQRTRVELADTFRRSFVSPKTFLRVQSLLPSYHQPHASHGDTTLLALLTGETETPLSRDLRSNFTEQLRLPDFASRN